MRALALLLLVLVPSVAFADPAPPKERHGVFGGFGLHGGNISCEGDNCGDFRKAGGGDGHLGWMVTPKLGVLLDVWVMTSKENNLSISYVTAAINARYYVAPIFWVQGGIGNGHAEVHYFGFGGTSDDVPVVELAAGVEVVRGKNWALDLEAKLAQGTSTDESENGGTTGRMVGIGAGFTWFGSR